MSLANGTLLVFRRSRHLSPPMQIGNYRLKMAPQDGERMLKTERDEWKEPTVGISLLL